MVCIGVIGHRYLGGKTTVAFVAQQCLTILNQAQAEHTEVTALSAIAEGADTLFAEAALGLGIPLDIVRPFEDYAIDFTTTHAQERYHGLRFAAKGETRLSYKKRSDLAYLAAMNWVVEHSDILVAAWDGRPPVGMGGTGNAVKQMLLNNRAWVHLNTVDLSVTFHSIEQARRSRWNTTWLPERRY